MKTKPIQINLGTDKKLATLALDLLQAAGYNVTYCRKGVEQSIDDGYPTSLFISSLDNAKSHKGTVIQYGGTGWFNSKVEGEYHDAPTLLLADTLEPIMIGGYKVTPQSKGVQVGCTFVSWETVEKVLALRGKS